MAFHPLNLQYPLPRPEFHGEEFHSLSPICDAAVPLMLDNQGQLWSVRDDQHTAEKYSGELRFFAHFAPEYMAGFGRGRAEFCALLDNGVVQNLSVTEVVRPYIGVQQ